MIAVYIIGGIFLAFILLQFFLRHRMKRMKGQPVPEVSGETGRALKGKEPVLIYFYSPACGACRQMTPVVEDMASRNFNVFLVNVAEDMETAMKFGVMGTPTTVLAEEGVIREIVIGPRQREELYSLL